MGELIKAHLAPYHASCSPAVEFCGYSAPHPSEAKIHLRVQMYDGKSAVDALHEALNNCEDMATAILDRYNESLEAGDFERVEDDKHDFESVNARLWAQKEEQGKGTYDEFLEEKRRKEEAEAAEAAKKRGKAIKR